MMEAARAAILTVRAAAGRPAWTELAEEYGQAILRAAAAVAHPDQWQDTEDGCWADCWHEVHEEYMACDLPPDPASKVGLCPRHEAVWRRRRAGATEVFDHTEKDEAQHDVDRAGNHWTRMPGEEGWTLVSQYTEPETR